MNPPMDRLARELAALLSAAALLALGCAPDEGSAPERQASRDDALADTFGKTTAGADWVTALSDYKRVSKFSLTDNSANIAKLTAYVDGLGATSGSQTVRGVIYDAAASGGLPGALLCVTSDATVSASTSVAWRDLAISGSCSLSAGDYWLGLQTGPLAGVLRYSTAPLVGGLERNDDAFTDGASNPFGAPSSSDVVMSIYATYDAVSGTAAPSVQSAASATANDAPSLAIAKPAATAKNDVLAAFVSTNGGQYSTVTAPTGWAPIPNADWKAGTTDAHLQGFYKVAGTSEPAVYTFTINGKQDLMGGIYAISGADTASPINASNGQGNTVASTGCTAPTIVPTAGNTLLLFGCSSSGGVATFTPPSGMTENWDVATGGTFKMATEGASSTQAGSGATGTKTATLSASKVSAAVLVAIAPAKGVGSTGDTTPPSAPSGLTATSGSGQVSLSWSASTDNVGVAGYRVYRSGALVGSPSGTSYTDSGLTNGTSYSYYVAAYDAAGNVSSPSSAVSATPVGCDEFASPTGSDSSGDGSLGKPYQTVAKLETSLAPGQTGCLRGGTYGSTSTLHSLTGGGTASSRITITAYPGEVPTVVGWFDLEGSYVTVSGLRIDESNTFFTTGCNQGPVSEGLVIAGSGDILEHNDIYQSIASLRGNLVGIGWWGSGDDTIVRYNRMHDAGTCYAFDHLIYLGHGNNVRIYGNWMWNDPHGWGVQIYPGPTNARVYANVIDGAGSGFVIGDDGSLTTTGNQVYNNVVVNSTGMTTQSGYFICGAALAGAAPVSGSNNSFTSNDAFNDPCGIGGQTNVLMSGNITSDPQFVDASTHNYQVGPTSPVASFGLWNGE